MNSYYECPRCGSEGYEKLSTHAYCVECNYCPDLEETFDANCLPIPPWAEKIVGEINKQKPEEKISTEDLGGTAA